MCLTVFSHCAQEGWRGSETEDAAAGEGWIKDHVSEGALMNRKAG